MHLSIKEAHLTMVIKSELKLFKMRKKGRKSGSSSVQKPNLSKSPQSIDSFGIAHPLLLILLKKFPILN
jgi:hypothetical protein